MKTQKQRIFSFLVLLTMVIVLTCIFVACDKGGAQDKNYTVTIHPDNGQADFVWDTKTDIPVITKYGYHIVGYYLDADMTISTTLESLKATNLTADLNVYVKWEKDSVPPKTKIVTKNLLCDYDTRALSGKVSNSTTVFSFYDEIFVEKGTTYTISTDINGINVIPSKTVNLEIGDNIFYVLVSNEDELTLYTATVRRKPIYTVTFDTLGGTEAEAQQVEEDAFATAPTTEKNGCTFEKWDWDFSMPITENTTITAIWNAFVYNIVYNFNIPEDSVSQEVDNSMNPTTYTVDDTIYFSAPRRNGYYLTGWSVSSISKGTTGTITTTAQWSLIPYEIIYDFGDSNSASKATNNDSNPRYYSVESEINFAEPTRAGYTFVSWDKNIEKGTAGTQTVTASWNVKQYNIEYVLNGWTNAENNKAIYTIEDKTFDLFDGINGKSLFCGWYLDDEYTNCIETIDASTMRDYTIYAMPDCGATKGLSIENGVVNGYFGTSSEVIIPSFYKGYTVNSLIESSFQDCSLITSVTVPNSVTGIGEGVFSGCSSLENITIPFVGAKAGVTSDDKYQSPFGYIFGTSSYDGGVATTQYYYGNSESSITSSIYYIPFSLKSVTVAGGDILDGAFYNCSDLMSITIPNNITCIGNSAFYGCTLLTNVAIPDSVTHIGYSAFSGCAKLTSVIIPNSVTNIGSGAFFGCTSLTNIIIPNSVTTIDGNAFGNCKSLTNVTIGNNVTTIATYAFSGCIGLTNIIIPNNVTSIGASAFNGCNGLTKVVIGDGVKNIGEDVFNNCSELGTIYYVGDIAKWCEINMRNSLMSGTRALYIDGNKIEGDLILSVDVTNIGSYAFSGCSGLIGITIPNSVTNIGYNAFDGCNKLQNIHINNISSWCNISGLYNLMGNESGSKKLFLNNELITSLIIPDGVTKIANYAFQGCTDLTEVLIGSGVKTIGDGAFKGCTSLIGITIPNNVTSIGTSVFENCTASTSVSIGSSVASIGRYAFKGCRNLTSIIVDEGNTEYYSYKNCLIKNSSKTLVLGCQTSVIPQYGNVKTIGDYAFYNCSGLTSITIPFSVTSIGTYAFSGCSDLKNIVFSGGKDQWKAMIKGTNWNNGVATDCTITCSDGTI